MAFTLFARTRVTDTPPPQAALDTRRVFANLSKVERLPHLSDTAVRAMALANNPDATLADMAALIRRDGVLAAGVLKVANSVVYRGSSEVTDLQQAVMRIGLRGCANFLSAAGVRNLYAKLPAAVRGPCEGVLRHSLFVGGLAAAFARALKLGFGGEEYTAGLLHDIGRVAMYVHDPEHSAFVCQAGYDADPEVRRVEEEAFGTDHCSVGLLFAVRNGLPLRIARAIQHHHTPDAEAEHRSLAAVVAFADAVADHLQKHRELNSFPFDTDPGFALLRRQVVSERVTEFLDGVRPLVKQSVRDTRAVLKSLEG